MTKKETSNQKPVTRKILSGIWQLVSGISRAPSDVCYLTGRAKRGEDV